VFWQIEPEERPDVLPLMRPGSCRGRRNAKLHFSCLLASVIPRGVRAVRNVLRPDFQWHVWAKPFAPGQPSRVQFGLDPVFSYRSGYLFLLSNLANLPAPLEIKLSDQL
jgi:hypothetical protein